MFYVCCSFIFRSTVGLEPTTTRLRVLRSTARCARGETHFASPIKRVLGLNPFLLLTQHILVYHICGNKLMIKTQF